MKQSIFEKYAIWHERLQKVNKCCCERQATLEIVNRLQSIQWQLICVVNQIENSQRQALSIISKKRLELLLVKDKCMQYTNPPIETVNNQLMAYILELPNIDTYSDFKEMALFAYETVTTN